MNHNISSEPMVDMFIFETLQLIDQLEQSVLTSEKSSAFEMCSINEIFRIMHTIKGSASMMLYNNIATLAHSIEDLFYYLREEKPVEIQYSKLTDIVLKSVDFIKNEAVKLQNGKQPDGDASCFIEEIRRFLNSLEDRKGIPTPMESKNMSVEEQEEYISCDKSTTKQQSNCYKAHIYFEEGCEMENIRAFTIIHNLKQKAEDIQYTPEDIIDNVESEKVIRESGFKISFKSHLKFEEINTFFMETVFLKDLQLSLVDPVEESKAVIRKKEIILERDFESLQEVLPCKDLERESSFNSNKQSIISVNVDKLDKLMDLVGELVISEAMVTENTELQGLVLNNFHKASRQLKKITSELQDIVMSIRMVPLTSTFQKMNRIVRDMNKKLDKEVELEIIGEETEVDKNIIEHISDPLMHLIRNSIDHGLECKEERMAKGKLEQSKITLEAKSFGGDVWIIVKDNGRGLNREKIIKKARENGLLNKPEGELSDREVYSFIVLPGFSTNQEITEFSGRGVGMDVVVKNIETIGGTILIDSIIGESTTISLKIPLTMAIIDGITIKVGNSRYTVPTISIKQSFKPKEENIIMDPHGNEMIMLRGECIPIVRLHQLYKVKTEVTSIQEGMLIIVENNSKSLCIFCDALLGEQEVVVKALPTYIRKVKGISGCTLLGDGSISLILDIEGLFTHY